jgi:hypothetical protein
MLWQSVGLTFQADTQPISYLLADRRTATEADLNIAANGSAGHEKFRSAAVGTDKTGLKLRTISGQAFGTEVGPGLARTAAIDDMNREPVALLESDRPLSFDWWSKSGKDEQRGGNGG